jgi:hypothetical protein
MSQEIERNASEVTEVEDELAEEIVVNTTCFGRMFIVYTGKKVAAGSWKYLVIILWYFQVSSKETFPNNSWYFSRKT